MTSNRHKPIILLVEDDPLLAMTMQRYLEQWSDDVRCAETGAQAAEQWASIPPSSMVLMDYRLPDARGTDVIAHMRKQGRTEPVICMTAESEVIEPAQQELLDIRHVLTKPVVLETLRDALDSLSLSTSTTRDHPRDSAVRHIGRYRHVRLRGTINGKRITRLCKAAGSETWMALDSSLATNLTDDAWRALCAWAGWLSSSGGRLYLVEHNADRRRHVEQKVGAYVDVIDDASRLGALGARLTGATERRQLLNVGARNNNEVTSNV